jgi:hypothetical protein
MSSAASTSTTSTELRSLLSGEIVHLYQNNPFRVLNIPFDATLREAEKRVQRLRVLHQTGQRTFDEFALREALQMLRDPKRRLLAELFWFIIDSQPASLDGQAMQKLREGQWTEARDIWRKLAGKTRSDETRRATHNLAVLMHARVVTMEAGKNPFLKRMTGNTPLPAEVLDGWREALHQWSEYWRDAAGWNHWHARVRAVADRRLRDDFVDELRDLLPDALLQINRDLARKYADAGHGLAAGTHCRLMQESGFAPELATQYARTVIDPLRSQITKACEEFQQSAQKLGASTASMGAVALSECVEQFGKTVGRNMALLSQIDEKRQFGASSAREAVAKALKLAAIEYVTDNRREYSSCLSLLQKALRFADSRTLQNDIKDLQQRAQREHMIWSRAPRTCLLCHHPPTTWLSFGTQANLLGHSARLSRMVFVCHEHSEAAHSARLASVANAKWEQLPLAPQEPRRVTNF